MIVLVEGDSDRIAIETLARRLGRDLPAEGIEVVSMGGVTNVRRFLDRSGPRDEVACLCDAGEERLVRRAFERAARDTERVFVCHADLEDELIRALGTQAVAHVVDAAGEYETYERFRRQPAQRDRPHHAQLRRFMGTRSGRKHRYAALLVDALDLARVPAPLSELLAATHAVGPR